MSHIFSVWLRVEKLIFCFFFPSNFQTVQVNKQPLLLHFIAERSSNTGNLQFSSVIHDRVTFWCIWVKLRPLFWWKGFWLLTYSVWHFALGVLFDKKSGVYTCMFGVFVLPSFHGSEFKTFFYTISLLIKVSWYKRCVIGIVELFVSEVALCYRKFSSS